MNSKWKTLFLLILCVNMSRSSEIRSSLDARNYLKQFGYFHFQNEKQSNRIPFSKDGPGGGSEDRIGDPEVPQRGESNRMFESVFKKFQEYTGLNPTGQFDNETMQMMNMPRCGMPERMELTENKDISRRRLSHRIPRRRRWRRSRIFYRIERFPGITSGSGIDSSTVRNEIRRAFRLWESVANIRCIELGKGSRRMAEIDISFVVRAHGDGTPFGNISIGNAVAHAFFPDPNHKFEGDIHFDNERLWTSKRRSGINLYQVAAHEIGHALGLDHSVIRESVMHMIVHSELQDNFQLHEDDIKGIQNLYGKRRQRSNEGRRRRPGGRLHWPTLGQISSVSSNRQRPVLTAKLSNNEIIENEATDKESPLETTLNSFWECFGLSYEPKGTKNATDCYARSVLNLIYSLRI